MKFSRIKVGRQGNFILGLLLLFFVFFGYISNEFQRDLNNQVTIGEDLIFMYQILFNPTSSLSFSTNLLHSYLVIHAFKNVNTH